MPIESRLTTTPSPDLRVRVEQDLDFDDRSGPYEVVRIFEVGSDEVILKAFNPGGDCGVAFPRAGVVELALRRGTTRPVLARIDIAARRYTLVNSADHNDHDQPLERLNLRLSEGLWTRTFQAEPAAAPAVRPMLVLLSLLGSLAMASGGVWMAAIAPTATERWSGVAGLVFFSACALGFWRDLQASRS